MIVRCCCQLIFLSTVLEKMEGKRERERGIVLYWGVAYLLSLSSHCLSSGFYVSSVHAMGKENYPAPFTASPSMAYKMGQISVFLF